MVNARLRGVHDQLSHLIIGLPIGSDELPETDLIGHVARKAAFRRPRFPEYDIRLWADQAHSLERVPDGTPVSSMVAEVVAELLASIDLRRTHHQRCWLNRVAIEHLYGTVASFEHNRHLLAPRLLDGPWLFSYLAPTSWQDRDSGSGSRHA